MGEVSLPLIHHPAGVANRALALLPDDRLANLAADGNQAAFAAIYRRHHQALYRYCRSILHNAQEAEDALQNTMLSALRALPGEQRQISLRPWLFRVAHNEAISMLRSRSPDASIDVAGAIASDHDDPAVRERLQALIGDLAALPQRQRSALVMRELNGLSYKEVGAAVDASEAAAKQLVYEARTALHEVEEGRDMSCDAARATISARDRRKLRSRKLRAHLRSCHGCQAFEASIGVRQADFAGIAPPLSAPAAAALLESILGGGGGSAGGGGLAGLAAGAAGESLGGSAAIKAASLAVAAGLGVAGAGVVVGDDLIPNALDRQQVAVAPAPEADTRGAGNDQAHGDQGDGGAAARPGGSGSDGKSQPDGNAGAESNSSSGPGGSAPPAQGDGGSGVLGGTLGGTLDAAAPGGAGGVVNDVDQAVEGSTGVDPGLGEATGPVTGPVDDTLEGDLPDVEGNLPDLGLPGGNPDLGLPGGS
jgi:RNA polymerase sigma factor (sigma-70 family)